VAMVEAARRRWGRIDILHYNVGLSIAGGDAPLDQIERKVRRAAVSLSSMGGRFGLFNDLC
jgi:hypothetical protein